MATRRPVIEGRLLRAANAPAFRGRVVTPPDGASASQAAFGPAGAGTWEAGAVMQAPGLMGAAVGRADPLEDIMSEPGLVDITGRLRSPAATPGHWTGCPPPNKGLRYPQIADGRGDHPRDASGGVRAICRPYPSANRDLVARRVADQRSARAHRDRSGPEDRIGADLRGCRHDRPRTRPRDDPELDVVLVALGGGALASGVGYVVRSHSEHAKVIGIQPAGAPAMALSWRHGTVVETNRIETSADGVAGRCPIREVLDDLRVVLNDVILVRENSIKVGMRMLYEHA